MRPAKPKLGQNFLTSPAARHRVVDALGDISRSTVLEIGPGKGALTDLLAARAGQLICVELDPALADRLAAKWAASGNVSVVQHDILSLDISHLAAQTHIARAALGDDFVIIGNLPYYITSDILLHLFQHADAISRAVLMVQDEVADRLAASPGVSDYGVLSATAQMHARVEKLFVLPPEAFTPPPGVNSAVVRLDMRARFAELHVERRPFLRFLQVCFQQKRKTLANNLKAGGFSPPQIMAALQAAELNPAVRAEAVSLHQIAQLFRDFYPQTSADSMNR